MYEVKNFTNNNFGTVRTMLIQDEPWFVGKDVAVILGYINPRDAIDKHVCTEDKGVAKCDTLGGTQDLTIINESGLYSLIFSSKLPKAKAFKRWVTSEVLPSIRKTGSYTVAPAPKPELPVMTELEIVAKVAMGLVEQEKRTAAIENKLKQTVEIFSAPAVSKDDWQEKMNKEINCFVLTNHLSQTAFRGELYAELEKRARVNLSARQKRLQERMKKGGAKYGECQAVSKLMVIANDAKLRELFGAMLRERKAKTVCEAWNGDNIESVPAIAERGI